MIKSLHVIELHYLQLDCSASRLMFANKSSVKNEIELQKAEKHI